MTPNERRIAAVKRVADARDRMFARAIEAVKSGIAAAEAEMAAPGHRLWKSRAEAYRLAAEALKAGRLEGLSVDEVIAECSGRVRNMEAVELAMRAIEGGMSLGEYTECDDVGRWLRERSTNGEGDDGSRTAG